MFSEFNPAGYQQPLIVRQSSPPVLPVRTLTPVLPVRVSSIQRSSPTTQTWQQSEIKYAPSIESTTFGSSNSLPPIVLPTYPRSQEQFVDQTVPPVMTQSLGAIPVGSVPLSPQSYNRTQVFSSAKIVPYLQVRAPQPQYDDYLIDQGPTSKVPEFKIQSPTALTSDKLINLQVIYVDSSEQENAIKKVFESQYIFLDGRFPPDYYQLFGNMDRRDPAFKQRAQVLAWRRFSEVYPNSDIFGAGISPFNIFQGGFGTCYFLVGLSTLAERPQRIRDLFIWDTINDHKVYVCTLLFRGRWKTIYVDEYFPLPRNEYLARGARGCSIGAKGQMWVSLLEKAWAKLYGSYFRVEGGYTEEGLHDLTGAHIRFVHTRSIEFVKEQGWKMLREATDAYYSILAESEFGSDTEISKSGMVFGHAYAVLGVYELTTTLGTVVQLVKCRNPWGQQEWVMDWSDTDPRWNTVSPQDIKRIGFNPNVNDGVFFIGYDDFCQWFTKITIAEIQDGSSYVYCTQQADQQRSGRFFKVRILKNGWYSFQLNQTPDKLLLEGQRSDFEYKTATINIGKLLADGGIEWQRGTRSNYRTIFRKLDLTQGDYIVYAEQQFYPSDPFRDITLCICGQFYCEISPAENNLTVDFHRKLLLSKGRKRATPISQGIRFVQEVLPEEGFLYVAVYNESNRSVRVQTRPYQNLNKSVNPVPAINNKIAPKEEFILFEKIPEFGVWTSGLCGVQIIE